MSSEWESLIDEVPVPQPMDVEEESKPAWDMKKATEGPLPRRHFYPDLDTLIPSVQPLSATLLESLTPHWKPTEVMPYPRFEQNNFEMPVPMSLNLKNPHPRDSRIIALDDPHVYFIDGDASEVMSSTQFLHKFFPEFDPEVESVKVTQRKNWQLRHRKSHKYHGCETPADVRRVWNRARDLGTDHHASVEKYINCYPIEECAIPDENEKCFQQFLDVQQDKFFWRWDDFATEKPVFDEETMLASKIDYLGIDPETGELIIVDWKRSNRISDRSFRERGAPPVTGYGPCFDAENCNYVQYSLQLNLYKYFLEKNYGYKVQDMYLIQTHPDIKNAIVIRVPNQKTLLMKMLACRKYALEQYRAQKK